MARIRMFAGVLVMLLVVCGLYSAFGSQPSSSSLPTSVSEASLKDLFSPTEKSKIARKPKYAITSSVQTASFTAMAVMLGYSIQKHNDLKAMDAELVLLVRDEGADAVTAENKTRLEKAGWKVRVAEELTFEGVDNGQIRAHHRHNLNKLHLWTWTEYEKILFIDADVVCKGSLAELWEMPGDFAAAPDVWWNILVDNRFNSGVIVFRPSMETFHDMIPKMSDPHYHSPNDADQAFLNAYYRFRYFGLPYKYNYNLVMYQYHREVWDQLWDEAVLVHFTMRKPKPNPAEHCHKGCNEWEPLEWYGQYFREMLAYHSWEKELPVYA
ncbi:Similar to Glycogenin-2; acc. no. O15488 [Pyronema omphalodes CBS 100304]|uniref:Similar to Glycogenin-2 acc. no. O15488 n=1 Tax=Pyronema omphalodes (strain CBS 100304) TaxID=1076935 RepID=U4KTX5_PYROM|nr:Similar to Glycogenin-2; acc. no. O15488 [Pyronema omphalodes CBS 100304]